MNIYAATTSYIDQPYVWGSQPLQNIWREWFVVASSEEDATALAESYVSTAPHIQALNPKDAFVFPCDETGKASFYCEIDGSCYPALFVEEYLQYRNDPHILNLHESITKIEHYHLRTCETGECDNPYLVEDTCIRYGMIIFAGPSGAVMRCCPSCSRNNHQASILYDDLPDPEDHGAFDVFAWEEVDEESEKESLSERAIKHVKIGEDGKKVCVL